MKSAVEIKLIQFSCIIGYKEGNITLGGQDMNCGYNPRVLKTNPNPVFGDVCNGYGFRYDCGNDDYFNPKPEPGNYFYDHWNLGSPLNLYIKFD